MPFSKPPKPDTDLQLRQSQSLLAEAEQLANLGSWEAAMDMATSIWSNQMYRIWGVPFDWKITPENFFQTLYPDDRPSFLALWQKVVSENSHEPHEIEYRILRPDGQTRHILGRGRLFFDQNNQPVKMIGTAQDITERKLADQNLRRSEEEQRRLLHTNQRLLQEVNHRVKNNLASILSILKLSASNAPSAQALATVLEGRVSAMARVHEILSSNHWNDIPLDQLAKSILLLQATTTAKTDSLSPPPQVHIQGPSHIVRARQAMPLGLILHELFINAQKYGPFASNPPGTVTLSWSLTPPKQLHMLWLEENHPDHPPALPVPTSSGVGWKLIEGFVIHDLKGRYQRSLNPNGLSCQITLPC